MQQANKPEVNDTEESVKQSISPKHFQDMQIIPVITSKSLEKRWLSQSACECVLISV